MIEEAYAPPFSLSLPAVVPWTRYPVCPKCAHSLGAGVWGLRRLFAAKGDAAQNDTWCRGDHNSTVQVPGMHFGSEGAQMRMADVPVTCFGVIDEHLHLRCGRCSFSWLMSVKGK